MEFLIYFEVKHFGISESMYKGSPALKNLEIMNMSGFGLSNNKIDKLLNRNWSEPYPGTFEPIICATNAKQSPHIQTDVGMLATGPARLGAGVGVGMLMGGFQDLTETKTKN